MIRLLLLLLPVAAFSQVMSVDMMGDAINKDATSNMFPSMNDKQDLLCFYRETVGMREIVISERSPEGQWSKAYAAYRFAKKDYPIGVRINSAGTRIYFGMRGDLYFIESIGGKNWGPPLRIDEPVSTEVQEDRPSFTADEQTLFFMRSIKTTDGWVATPFVLRKGDPQNLVLRHGSETLENFFVTPNERVAIFSTATPTAYHNYFSIRTDSGYTNKKSINYSTGPITWISGDMKMGLAESLTKPRKIVALLFSPGWLDPYVPAKQTVASRETPTETSAATSVVKPDGKYYALLIGNSNYDDTALDLDRPVKDAAALSDILIQHYGFESNNVRTLLNPTRQQILSALFSLRSVVTPSDNLLIFYAGHGYWDDHIKQGYWWPRDAKPNDPSFWLSNSDLREQIRGVKSGHTLLISDACFSGGIFRLRGANEVNTAPLDIQVLYKTKSRRAITSGNLSTVPDQSVFFDYLTKRLVDNNEKFLASQMLFSSFKTAVINNSLSIPQDGVISDSGDEGGDFIFVKSK
jgi:hypothetical protein